MKAPENLERGIGPLLQRRPQSAQQDKLVGKRKTKLSCRRN